MNRRKTTPPRGVLTTAAADPRRYQHARYHPSPDLEPYVEHYWSVRWDLRGLAPETAETLPHPSVHMIFERHGRSRIAGVARGKFSRVLEGEGGVFAAKFRPGGFHPFAGVPISTFTGTTVRLREVFGADGDALDQAVLAEETDSSRLAIVEEFLRRRRPRPDEHVARIAEIVYAVADDRGIVKVDDLVDRYRLNKRTLQRLFAKYVGVSPKWVIQRYRLHEAAEQLAAGPSISQSTLALELGYSDQAHFARDFKNVVGTSPAAYARKGADAPHSAPERISSAGHLDIAYTDTMKRIGILTAGGDTPALNAAIHGAVVRANQLRIEIYGLIKGFNCLFNPRVPHVHLNPLFQEIPELDPTKGGTLIGSSRDYIDPDKKDELDLITSRLNKLGIEGLIAVGGDGTLNGLQPLVERLPTVLAPKTIDNDLGLNHPERARRMGAGARIPTTNSAITTSKRRPTRCSISTRSSTTRRLAMRRRSW